MSDSTQFQMTIYACPPEGVAAVIDALNEFYIGMDWSPDAPEPHDKLVLNAQYTDHSMRVGGSDDLAAVLVEAGATFEGWEDPCYEWLGSYHVNVPGVGYFSAECSADGNVQVDADELVEMVMSATDLDELRARIQTRTGYAVHTAIVPFRNGSSEEIELFPLVATQ